MLMCINLNTMFTHFLWSNLQEEVTKTNPAKISKLWTYISIFDIKIAPMSIKEANFHSIASAEVALTNTEQFLPHSPLACLPYCTCLSQSSLISNLHNLQNHTDLYYTHPTVRLILILIYPQQFCSYKTWSHCKSMRPGLTLQRGTISFQYPFVYTWL
jgi:hypothetical protein